MRLPLVLFADDYGGCAFPDEQEFGEECALLHHFLEMMEHIDTRR